MPGERIPGMFSSLARFLWIAFVEHFGAWVTGTGLIGFLLWLLNYLQYVTGRKMTRRQNLIVLFCTFWFIGTFSAWHDADRNLQSVIAQRATDTSNLNTCSTDLKIAQSKAEFFEKQESLGLTNFSIQQQTLNSCVLQLRIANKKVPLTMTVREALFPGKNNWTIPGFGDVSLAALVVHTNQTVTPVHGTLTCNGTFALLGAGFALSATSMVIQEQAQMVGYSKAKISIDAPAWNPETPIVAVVGKRGESLSPCSFTLD
jgi:hypothetical protein